MVEDENGAQWNLPQALDEIAEKIDDAHELYLNMLLRFYLSHGAPGTDPEVYKEIYNEKS